MSTEPTNIKQQLEAEQTAIAAITDPLEQALAQAAFTARVSTIKGERGAKNKFVSATQELARYRAEKALKNQTTDQETEESQLVAARDAALTASKTKPITNAKLKALKKAEKDLEAFRAKRDSAIEKTFAKLPDVIAYLEAEGWKISTSTAYEHKQDGKIKTNQDGKYTLNAVLDYARQHLQRKDGTEPDDKTNLQEQKITAEIRRIEADAETRELKLKERRGELIPRDHVEVELSSRARDLDAHLDAFFRSAAGRIIKIVGGDMQKAPDLITFMRGAKKQAMDNYARPIHGPNEEE